MTVSAKVLRSWQMRVLSTLLREIGGVKESGAALGRKRDPVSGDGWWSRSVGTAPPGLPLCIDDDSGNPLGTASP